MIRQITAARAMLGLSQQELSSLAGISMVALNNIEHGVKIDDEDQALNLIKIALEAEGIAFTKSASGDLTVKLTSPINKNNFTNVLIIDDNNSDRKLYKSWLARQDARDYHIIEASDAKEGYDAVIKYSPACIVLDFMLCGKDGFWLLLEMKVKNLHIPPVIFITGQNSQTIRRDALTLGAELYLDKSILTQEIFCNAVYAVIG
jgi:DNA-binding response OmpR family regulator